MTDTAETLPTDLVTAHAMILAERAARLSAESDRRALDIEIERLKLEIARLKRERYGQSAERSARIEQLELSLEDLEESAAAITQPPAPFHAIARGRAGAGLLAGGSIQQVRPAPAAAPPKRAFHPGRGRDRRFHPGRLGRRRQRGAAAAGRGHPRPCARRAAHPCGRHARAGAGERQDQNRPLVDDLAAWLYHKRAGLSGKSDTAKAMDYLLKRWPAFTLFLGDGRVDLSNNAAERALRGIAVGRRNWTFAGSDAGGRRAAALYTLIETCKMNGIDPRAWLADVLERLPGHSAKRIDELLPWNWKGDRHADAA